MVAMRVLIVDDEEDVRRIAVLSLKHVGKMDVAEAASASVGLEMAIELRPDVILLDVMMPGMDGPEVLARLRERPETASIPVVFVTAHALPAEIEHLKRLGAISVVTKPFDAMELPKLISEVVR